MKFKERRIFMFEQIIIVSEMLEKKKGFSNPGYVFKNSFQVGIYVQFRQLKIVDSRFGSLWLLSQSEPNLLKSTKVFNRCQH